MSTGLVVWVGFMMKSWLNVVSEKIVTLRSLLCLILGKKHLREKSLPQGKKKSLTTGKDIHHEDDLSDSSEVETGAWARASYRQAH